MLRAIYYMNLHQQIEADLKTALKSGDKEKAGTLRFLISALKNFQIEKKTKDETYLSDQDVVAVLKRQAKQRKDSIEGYEKGARADLAEKEKKELAILAAYLPAEMDEQEVQNIVCAKIQDLGISGKADFGKLMGAAVKEVAGKADGGLVKKIVDQEIAKLDQKKD
jgi:uncharacterized protein